VPDTSYPALADFLASWFHQDFDIEGETVAEVVAAYRSSSPLQRRPRSDATSRASCAIMAMTWTRSLRARSSPTSLLQRSRVQRARFWRRSTRCCRARSDEPRAEQPWLERPSAPAATRHSASASFGDARSVLTRPATKVSTAAMPSPIRGASSIGVVARSSVMSKAPTV
jgi:hypothetical protein